MSEYWNALTDFITKNDFRAVMEKAQHFDWAVILKSFYFWLITLPILGYLLKTRKWRILIFMVTFGLFLVLVKNVIPPPGQAIPLHSVLVFIGGALGLVVINIYFLFMRD